MSQRATPVAFSIWFRLFREASRVLCITAALTEELGLKSHSASRTFNKSQMNSVEKVAEDIVAGISIFFRDKAGAKPAKSPRGEAGQKVTGGILSQIL